jgi:hypothetical protein
MAKSGWLALNGVVLLLSRWLGGRIMGQHPDKLPGGPDSRTPRASEVHHA